MDVPLYMSANPAAARTIPCKTKPAAAVGAAAFVEVDVVVVVLVVDLVFDVVLVVVVVVVDEAVPVVVGGIIVWSPVTVTKVSVVVGCRLDETSSEMLDRREETTSEADERTAEVDSGGGATTVGDGETVTVVDVWDSSVVVVVVVVVDAVSQFLSPVYS